MLKVHGSQWLINTVAVKAVQQGKAEKVKVLALFKGRVAGYTVLALQSCMIENIAGADDDIVHLEAWLEDMDSSMIKGQEQDNPLIMRQALVPCQHNTWQFLILSLISQ